MPRLIRFLPYLILVALLTLGTSGTAQQGLSPFADQAPDATPGTVASPVAAIGWHIIDQREIAVDGEFVTLSPDGQWIAGTGDNREVCIWAVETLAPTCAIVDLHPDHHAMRWSPDSTAIVWTHQSVTTFTDSDLYLMEVPSGIVTNLTDDQVHAPITSMEEEPSPGMVVDQAPAWTPDSQAIVFSRLEWGDSGGATSIYSIARGGGAPQFIHQPEANDPWSITSAMHVLSDGSILYSVTAPGGGKYNGLWLLPSDGEPQQILPGDSGDDFPSPIIVDVFESPAGTIVSGASLGIVNNGGFSLPYSFQLDLATGSVTPGAAWATPDTFSHDGSATVHEEQLGALIITDGETRSNLGNISGSRYAVIRGIDWSSNNTLLVLQGVDGATLLSVAPSS